VYRAIFARLHRGFAAVPIRGEILAHDEGAIAGDVNLYGLTATEQCRGMVRHDSHMASPCSDSASTASARLWGLDWRSVLPFELDGVTVEVGHHAEQVVPFVREHYATIFCSDESPFLLDPMTEAKQRFVRDMDAFVFRAEGRTVGILLAHPSDWSTYYMRTVAILPEYRERRLLSGFMDLAERVLLAAGVERVEGDCSPANAPMMRMLTARNFLVTSTIASERWGLMVRFTKLLREDARAVFLRQFGGAQLGGRPRVGINQERRTT
jgi:hypothetical protein